MARVKGLTLLEARRVGKLKEFAEQQGTVGDEAAFDRLFRAMASGTPPKGNQTSGSENSED